MTVRRYRVRRWTAFTWSSGADDREGFVRRAGERFQRELRDRYPAMDCSVDYEDKDGQPELIFSATVYAETTVEAKRRAAYRFEKAMTTTVPLDGRERRIVLPWGKMTARCIDA